jgi:hypothetical protein
MNNNNNNNYYYYYYNFLSEGGPTIRRVVELYILKYSSHIRVLVHAQCSI